MKIHSGSAKRVGHKYCRALYNKIYSHEYTKTTFPLLFKQLRECESKQLSMYAEKSIITITKGNKKQFLNLLEERYPELEKYSH